MLTRPITHFLFIFAINIIIFLHRRNGLRNFDYLSYSQLVVVVQYNLSRIAHRKYIDQIVSFPYLVDIASHFLQRWFRSLRTLVKELQFSNQLFNTFNISLQQDPPSHSRHLYLQPQKRHVHRCSRYHLTRIVQTNICLVEIIEKNPSLLANLLTLRMPFEWLE